jgi:hypothetical protein
VESAAIGYVSGSSIAVINGMSDSDVQNAGKTGAKAFAFAAILSAGWYSVSSSVSSSIPDFATFVLGKLFSPGDIHSLNDAISYSGNNDQLGNGTNTGGATSVTAWPSTDGKSVSLECALSLLGCTAANFASNNMYADRRTRRFLVPGE